MPEINGIRLPFIPAAGVGELNKHSSKVEISPGKTSFNDIFQNEISKLKFSGHAQTRMVGRDINLSEADILRLEDAVDRAKDKGANESLVIMDDKAFIVSIPNKTVITMINRNQMDENVITKIDSAVFA